MNKMRELYHEEKKNLDEFKEKISDRKIYKEDLNAFADSYDELVAQARVITRVSDRLQKKLDTANTQIKEQNDEITEKNVQLEKTIEQLMKARVGKKASTIMLFLAIFLFVTEEYFMGPVIESFISIPYLDLVIKGLIAFSLKFVESGLETYFMKQEQSKILKEEKNSEVAYNPALVN